MLDMRFAEKTDVPLILSFIQELAEFEKLSHEVVATADQLEKTLFGDRSNAEVLLGYYEGKPVAFALFFHNYSTFLAKPGLYLEDLYVKPAYRSMGFGKQMLQKLAVIAKERDCGRFEWWVLNWNQKAIQFYESIGAKPMDEWTVFRVDGESLDKLSGC